MDLLVADAARVDGRGIRVLRIEDHGLVGWVHLLRGHGEGGRPAHAGVHGAGPAHAVVAGRGPAVPHAGAHAGVDGTGPAHAVVPGAGAAVPHARAGPAHAGVRARA